VCSRNDARCEFEGEKVDQREREVRSDDGDKWCEETETETN